LIEPERQVGRPPSSTEQVQSKPTIAAPQYQYRYGNSNPAGRPPPVGAGLLAGSPTEPAVHCLQSPAFAPNPSQTPFERSALGCVNDARTDVAGDAGKAG
jgi:hypothetical protein